jgi:eukaryotic-like serine/threonine-protein kinase
MPGKVTLEVTAGPITDQVYNFEEHDTFIFGRDDDCHARLSDKDATASRHHFILEVNPPDARIRDLGSLNGTYVNGTKYGGRPKGMTPEEALKLNLPEVDVKDQDEIRVGETAFRVRVEVPVVCARCDTDIPHKFKRVCEWRDGMYVCPDCREKVEKEGLKTKPPEPVRCSHCGKVAGTEVGAGRRGDYVCKACQSAAEVNLAALLDEMMKRARGKGQGGYGNIEDYEFGEELGCGGMGCVYLSRRKSDGATVAIKVMLAKVAVDEHSRDVFRREIDVTKNLHHPNIVELFDHGSYGSGFYFALEYCAGGSVYDLMLKRRTALSLAEAGRIIMQALEGLSYAHEQKFVHRDLKPQNILLTAQEGGVAKVADFGLAKNFDKAGLSGMTATGDAAGTFPFMPREQLTNFKYMKPVSDVWSMGATLYFMLTGETPLDFPEGQSPAEVVMRGEIVSLRHRQPSIPIKVAEVIDRAVARNAKDRYQTAAEFRDALVKVL